MVAGKCLGKLRKVINYNQNSRVAIVRGQYVSQCLTCRRVRYKPGDIRFHSKNIQSGYFNELLQYDHMEICTSTSKLLLQNWFASHGTPTRMQSDTVPNLTAEVSNELMEASQITEVTSTAGHPRNQGLVEQTNLTLLSLLNAHVE